MAESNTSFLSGLGNILGNVYGGGGDGWVSDQIRNIIERIPGVASPGSEPGDWNQAIRLRKDAMQYIKDQGFLTDAAYEALSEAVAHYEGPFQERQAKEWEGEGHDIRAWFSPEQNAIFGGSMSNELENIKSLGGWDKAVRDLAGTFLHEYGHYLDWNPSGVGRSGHRPGEEVKGRPALTDRFQSPSPDFQTFQKIPRYQGEDPYKWYNPREHFAVNFEEAALGAKTGGCSQQLGELISKNPAAALTFGRVIPNFSEAYWNYPAYDPRMLEHGLERGESNFGGWLQNHIGSQR